MQTVEDFDQQRESPVKEKKRDYPHINDTPGVGYRSKGSNFVIGYGSTTNYPITTISNHDNLETSPLAI